jgi:hypothetical protein
MRTILLLFIFVLFSSCRKDCPGDSFSKGIIIQEISFGPCIPPTLPQTEYIIDNDTVYQQLLSNSVCSGYTLPAIDFAQYTLLGKYATGQCKVEFHRQVTKDDAAKTYNFTIYVCDRGICKKAAIGMNWVTVPKLPQGYTVTFTVKHD